MGDSKVVSLNGLEVKAPYEPRPAVIECLERALEQARSGEIVGVVVVFTHGDDATSYCFNGANTRATLGALEMLRADVCDHIRGHSE